MRALAWRLGLYTALCVSLLSCGGGSDNLFNNMGANPTPPPATSSNVVSVVVDAGPIPTSPDVNTLFVSVKVCVPGSTTNCQTIDHIQVDTGSYGLRLLASALTLTLPVQASANSSSLVECTQFVDGYAWGPVATADILISGETASSAPVQIIGDSRFPDVPTDCSGTGTAENTVAAFHANGVLGIGVFIQDCGPGCASTVDNGFYFSCTSSQCQASTAALTSQVTNPIALFATDNNGVIIQLPSVAADGAATVTGSMIFGIDTQSNNKSGSQAVLEVDPDFGYFSTVYKSQSLPKSFLDTGSNGFYFNDTDIPQCTDSHVSDFYCPTATQNLTATLEGKNAVSASASFVVVNAATLASSGNDFVALPGLAGPFPTVAAITGGTFDWGLPFYYGRTVYTALENAKTAAGTGPYIAF